MRNVDIKIVYSRLLTFLQQFSIFEIDFVRRVKWHLELKSVNLTSINLSNPVHGWPAQIDFYIFYSCRTIRDI